MTATKLKKVPTGDRDLDAVQVAVATAIDPLLSNVLLGGRLTDPITLTSAAGTTRVAHGLGRVPIGWFIVSPTSSYGNDVYMDPFQGPDAEFLYLATNDTNVSFRLWVF